MIILIVDDDMDILELMADGFREAGFDVLSASDGEKAYKTLTTTNVDVILSDVVMAPMDGFELLVLAKDLLPNLPIFFMTGHPGRLANSKLLFEAFEGVLIKPFDLDIAIHEISAAMRAKCIAA